MLTSLHLSISSSFTALATSTHNNKDLAPYVLPLALAEQAEGNKGCVETFASFFSKVLFIYLFILYYVMMK
jgi:hypothetical protein